MGVIIDFIRSNRWDDLALYLSTSRNHRIFDDAVRKELSTPDRLGRTPLHYACAKKRAPSSVVVTMLDTLACNWSESLSIDICGNTLLHAAAACGNAGVVRVLLEKQACRVPFRSLNDNGLTPLVMAWKKFLDPSFSLFASSETIPATTTDDTPEQIKLLTQINSASQLEYPHFDQLEDLWNKTAVLVYATSQPNMKYPIFGGAVWRPLHSLIRYGGEKRLGCPSVAVWFAVSLYSDQLLECDEDGNFPLHLAAIHRECLIIPTNITHPPNLDNSHESQPSQPLSPDYSTRSIIVQLAKCTPQASKCTNREGRLPLHLAIHSGKPWIDGIDVLVEAYPESLEQRDPITELVPFLLAACCPSCSLTVTWQLLRAKPDLIGQRTESTTSSGMKRKLFEGEQEFGKLDPLKKGKKTISLQYQ